MAPTAVIASAVSRSRPYGQISGRALLLLVTTFALGSAGLAAASVSPSMVEPDLARLLRYMAVLKGAFAAIAFGVGYWRLGRPSRLWRAVVYVAAPGLTAGGALCLWHLQSAGLAAAGLHIGLFALLGAALTDDTFFPSPKRPSV